ncbi:ShET2/EspL2 family type III secretion system effector toxin [Candidatus Ichthyocystis sparus]|uniref:ShET2/EspL2 family type III secretion system effector toxin n=1 Tax=Candidatus Ichthyocystis sparus TaxID=1561004 RepID=UPI000B896ECC|nr:ShET2/EspL2 family type III secretion system effector toxin [Candidatus Ichthyocystis sparus]
MNFNYNTHVHISSHTMEVIPSYEKNSPYISKKNAGSLLNLNGKVEIDGEIISCTYLSSLFALNSIDCYRNNKKMEISKLFSDEDSIKRAIPGDFKGIHENMVKNSCGKHIIACGNFGNFLHKIASSTTYGEQRFFILQSCGHVMSFKIIHKTKKVGELLLDRWVVHFFDPNKTNVVVRSEVLNTDEFLDLRKFSLQMFMSKSDYKDYFEGSGLGPVENECAVYECSDRKNESLCFSTLETLSQCGISGCMIYHMMYSNIRSLDIRELARSRSFSNLSSDVRKEIFFAKSSLNISALHLAIEHNNFNSIRSYDNFLEELSYDEQVSILPDIVLSKSHLEAPALFVAMQNGSNESIDGLGLLINRLMNVRHRIPIENFSEIIFDVFLAKRTDGLSALSMALFKNKAGSILAFSRIMDRIFMLKDVMDGIKLSNLIFRLLHHKYNDGRTALFIGLSYGSDSAIVAFGLLVDKLLVMKGYVPDSYIVDMVFRLLRSRTNRGIPGLFFSLQDGHANAVRAFGSLIDKLLVMKGHVPDNRMANMIFELLIAKSDTAIPGLFFALQNNHANTVFAFSELIYKLLAMKGHVSDSYMANMIFELLMPKSDTGIPGLFFALQEGYTNTIIAFGGLVSKFALLKQSIPEARFNSMMLDILMARRSDSLSGILMSLIKNSTDVIAAYGSLLVYAPKEVRKEIFFIKDNDGFPALYALISSNKAQSIITYDYFLKMLLSCDEQMDILPELLISKNDKGDPALFLAMQEGYDTCIDEYATLIENQLMTVKDRMSPGDFANLVLNIVSAKRTDGISALFMGMYNNRVSAIKSYAGLLDKVLLLLKGIISDYELADIIYKLISCCSPSYGESIIFTGLHMGYAGSIAAFGLLVDKLVSMKNYIPHGKLVDMIFELLKARNRKNFDGLFIALQKGNIDEITAFGFLLDKFISIKGYTDDIPLIDMLFDLLMCKSGDDDVPGLFMAMQEGHHVAVDAFRKLIEKIMIFEDHVFSGYFNNMLLNTVISRRSDGVSGLLIALKNNFPKVIRAYGLLLSLIPKDELVNVLIASDSLGVPAALFAGNEALSSYLEIISNLPTEVICALYSRLNSIKISIEHILSSDSDLNGKYELLLKNVKELARNF